MFVFEIQRAHGGGVEIHWAVSEVQKISGWHGAEKGYSKQRGSGAELQLEVRQHRGTRGVRRATQGWAGGPEF